MDPEVQSSRGLSSVEADRRLHIDGPNDLPHGHRRSVARLFVGVISEPLILLLVGAAVLYLLFGEPRDALLLAGSVGVIVGLDVVQEHRAERTLETLQTLTQPTARAIRDGAVRMLPSGRLVRGDRILLSAGERVPADARVVAGSDLLVDESLLTGESAPVRKSATDVGVAWQKPGGDDLPFLYASTLVVRGEGAADVVATGPRTEVSRIAVALSTIETGTPILRRQTRGLVWGTAMLAVIGTLIVAVAVGLRTNDWLAGLLAGTALAIGLLPEEIPVVLTLYSVLGARRMVRHRALARRFGTIPSLGAVDLLLSDKTGTMTQNRMEVAAVCTASRGVDRISSEAEPGDRAVRELLGHAYLASEVDSLDPMDQAIARVGRSAAFDIVGPHAERVRYEPFTPTRRSVSCLWATGSGGDGILASKGAPEVILASALADPEERRLWADRVRELTREGLRVLAVTGARSGPRSALGTAASSDATVGLIGLADPLRPGVLDAVRECQAAGIRVVMVTGDHPETARTIARSAGLRHWDRALTGTELDALGETALAEKITDVDVFARIAPEQKLRLVEAFRTSGATVAMTGDGVNDAPALRAADVGIAMGGRGTDVAREAASLILMDDAFPTIVEAIRSGRRIYGNMRKAIAYIIGVHVALAGMALLPVLLGLPILLYPVEIVFLELIVDPTASLALEAEPEEGELMRQAPRSAADSLPGRRLLMGSLLVGVTALLAAFLVYYGALSLGHPADESRALSFAALVVSNLAMLHLNRSYSVPFLRAVASRNLVAILVTVFGAALLLGAIYLPGLDTVFQFLPPAPVDLLIAVGVGLLSVLWFDPFKRFFAEAPRAHEGSIGAPPRHPSGHAPGPG